ncbi:MAG: hypothetical protein QXF97_06515 [Candidatus Caldarchaeum sp.]
MFFVRWFFIVRTLKGDVVIVDKRCKICTHEKRAEIENMLLEGKTYAEISQKYGVDDAGLSRHFRKHFPRLMNQAELEKIYHNHMAKQIDLQEELLNVVGRLNDLFQKLERFDKQFEEGKVKPHAYVESVAERRQILQQIRESLITIQELKTEIKTEKDLSELLQKLRKI